MTRAAAPSRPPCLSVKNPKQMANSSLHPVYHAMSKFQGFTISQNEDGFFWQEGGYFDTIEECRADIADWNAVTDQLGEFHRQDQFEELDPPWWAFP
jgi:hypothetical protein